ncbi:general secretion pathway protein H [Imhoffiella purpurea]|uniref:General secretion pathway protein H n=1 Tax=Imhoffiella purpurea TaxID=1249627 RepID=W9VJD1_9GAMM|nr:general secretion pathway protein H [Imhoffiella purpurea]
MVAFAILAISLGVLLQIFSRATLTAATTSQYVQAASLAESLLNDVDVDIPLLEGAVSDRSEDGFDWEVTIVRVEFNEEAFFEPPATPYRVNATVIWDDAGRTRHLTLSTLRLGEKL